MADFQKAIEWMKEGKKVRRKDHSWFCKLRSGKIRTMWISGGKEVSLESLTHFEATDWEIDCEEHDWFLGFVCNKCGNPEIYEKDMGHKCSCGNWLYHHKCFKDNVCKNCGMEKHKESLSDKRFDTNGVLQGKIFVRDVKEKIQNVQKRLLNETYINTNGECPKEIMKIFKEEFGDDLL